jgi:hypothetical protein
MVAGSHLRGRSRKSLGPQGTGRQRFGENPSSSETARSHRLKCVLVFDADIAEAIESTTVGGPVRRKSRGAKKTTGWRVVADCFSAPRNVPSASALSKAAVVHEDRTEVDGGLEGAANNNNQ